MLTTRVSRTTPRHSACSACRLSRLLEEGSDREIAVLQASVLEDELETILREVVSRTNWSIRPSVR
ncbi:hypothetical protein DV706_18955 (plasmid) [Natronorubrum bangense]|uniref:Uncharacterized protein n=1 Tax=Natronorubrum bangense TaxID=61858 RepID=A0A4D6HT07_9EURY|nr:hypothetical protein DV706_18955 [Natronorubrum bangense]